MLTVFLFSQTLLLSRAYKRASGLTELYPRIVFSRSMLRSPDIEPAFVFDHNIETAWWDTREGSDVRSGKEAGPIPPTNMHYLMFELSPTHYPDSPPRKNKVRELIIYPGNQARGAFRQYARPRTIELIFFSQQLVDPDREFKLPGAPEFLYRKKIVLEDRPQGQHFPLDLPAVPDSPVFPVHVAQLWLRLEFIDFYPGDVHHGRVAISEIDFVEVYPTHRNFKPDETIL
ncbi:MAG: hypothetical protein HS115_08005 [Spirochaetales bacterium]|nr:hypothetical protein [Spirochaetales bacterium]